MTPPSIAVGSLGGTITMTSAGAAAVQPTLTAAELVASVPGLELVAEPDPTTIATKPGASLTRSDLVRALHWARSAVDRGAAGAIVIQGTDTIEESAYFLDLYWDREEPLVVTGAMRHPAAAGADGPGNLLAAATVAAAHQSHARGVLVVMNDEVHAASRVRKARGSGPSAFTSVPFGPLGFVEEGSVHYGSPASRWLPLGAVPPHESPRVPLLETHLGDDGSLVDLMTKLRADGVVVGALGVGHVPAAVAEAISRAVSAVPVVFATRTGAGTTYSATYGFVGSESDLLSRRAIAAGWLQPAKARLLLAELLATGLDQPSIVREFASRGLASPEMSRDLVMDRT